VTISDSAAREIYDAVRTSIWAGVSPETFLEEVLICWKTVLEEEKDSAERAFKKVKV
jgi:hypothetical protein